MAGFVGLGCALVGGRCFGGLLEGFMELLGDAGEAGGKSAAEGAESCHGGRFSWGTGEGNREKA
jgi:hypothetical protein